MCKAPTALESPLNKSLNGSDIKAGSLAGIIFETLNLMMIPISRVDIEKLNYFLNMSYGK